MGASQSNLAGRYGVFVSGWDATDWMLAGVRPAVLLTQAPASAVRLSAWTLSPVKRLFDVACVLCALPVVLLLCLLVALAVRSTSPGPVFYRQRRMGRDGRAFTIFKFRTMPALPPEVQADSTRAGVTTESNQRFTLVGPLLRRWKLDELPQLWNILCGEMSLVGPRPKLADFEAESLPCRPGLTGFATMVFAREERAMAQVPCAEVEAYYQAVVKPFKHKLDVEYLQRATFFSDLVLIVRSVLRRWDDMALSKMPPWVPQGNGAAPSARMVVEKPAMQGPEQALAER